MNHDGEHSIGGKVYKESEVRNLYYYWKRKLAQEGFQVIIQNVLSNEDDVALTQWVGAHANEVMDSLLMEWEQQQFYEDAVTPDPDPQFEMVKTVLHDLYASSGREEKAS